MTATSHRVPVEELAAYANGCLAQARADCATSSPYDVTREALLAQGVIDLLAERDALRAELAEVRAERDDAFSALDETGGEA